MHRVYSFVMHLMYSAASVAFGCGICSLPLGKPILIGAFSQLPELRDGAGLLRKCAINNVTKRVQNSHELHVTSLHLEENTVQHGEKDRKDLLKDEVGNCMNGRFTPRPLIYVQHKRCKTLHRGR